MQTKEYGDVPFYKIGTLGDKPDAFISKELFEEYKEKYNYPLYGETLITCSGTVGKCIKFDGNPAYFQDSNIVWLHPESSTIHNSFLNILLNNYNWNYLNSTTITRIYTSDLFNIKLYYPTLSEQLKLIKFIDLIDYRILTQSKIIKAIESQIFIISHIMICNSTETIKFKNLCTLENKTARKSSDGIKDGIYPFFTNEENQTQFLNDYDFDGEYIIANTGGRANFKYYNGKFAVMSDSLVIKIKNPKLTTFYNNVLIDKQAYINHVGFEGSGLKHLNKDWLLNLQVPVFNEHTKKYLFVVEELKNKLTKEKDILSLYKKQKAYLLQNMFI